MRPRFKYYIWNECLPPNEQKLCPDLDDELAVIKVNIKNDAVWVYLNKSKKWSFCGYGTSTFLHYYKPVSEEDLFLILL